MSARMVTSSQLIKVVRKLPTRSVTPTSMLTVTARAATAKLLVCRRTARLRRLRAGPRPRGRTRPAARLTTSGTINGRASIINPPKTKPPQVACEPKKAKPQAGHGRQQHRAPAQALGRPAGALVQAHRRQQAHRIAPGHFQGGSQGARRSPYQAHGQAEDQHPRLPAPASPARPGRRCWSGWRSPSADSGRLPSSPGECRRSHPAGP